MEQEGVKGNLASLTRVSEGPSCFRRCSRDTARNIRGNSRHFRKSDDHNDAKNNKLPLPSLFRCLFWQKAENEEERDRHHFWRKSAIFSPPFVHCTLVDASGLGFGMPLLGWE